MDKRLIKSIILELRDKETDPKSYAQISKILKEEYGVTYSRQAVHNIYVKSKQYKGGKELKKHGAAAVTDVINILAMGYNMGETLKIAASFGHDLSYYNIRELAESEQTKIETVERSLVDKVANKLLDKQSRDSIKETLVYNGIQIKETGWQRILADAHAKIITDEILKKLYAIYNEDGLDILRMVTKKTNMDIPISTIKASQKDR